MPGCGIVRIAPDLRRQEIVPPPDALKPLNCHSTKLGRFAGLRGDSPYLIGQAWNPGQHFLLKRT